MQVCTSHPIISLYGGVEKNQSKRKRHASQFWIDLFYEHHCVLIYSKRMEKKKDDMNWKIYWIQAKIASPSSRKYT